MSRKLFHQVLIGGPYHGRAVPQLAGADVDDQVMVVSLDNAPELYKHRQGRIGRDVSLYYFAHEDVGEEHGWELLMEIVINQMGFLDAG